MRFEGLKSGGLYKVVCVTGGDSARALRAERVNIKEAFDYTFIPNNKIIMFLKILDDGDALILYRDKTWRLSRRSVGQLRPLDPENIEI